VCGIAGIAWSDPERPVPEGLLGRMVEAVRHRGPDGEGFWRAPGIGLGVRRLAIIDPAGGRQPIAGEDGAVVVICNGEIYGFEAQRDALRARGHRFRTGSDVEVIVHLYEERGVECLAALRGMFALALWDGRTRRLILARDPLGIKPLHYAVDPAGLWFGSEQKALLAAERAGGGAEGAILDRRLDLEALRDLLRHGFIHDPRTLFTGIRQVPPGHYLVWERGQATLRRWWELDFPDARDPGRRLSAAGWAEALRATLETSVRLHARSDVPVGIWLSAGVDSSGVASLTRAAVRPPIPVFSVGFAHAEVDEIGRQATLDRFPGYDLAAHRVICGRDALARLPAALWHAESPAVSGVEIPRLILAEATARHVKVVLTGEGSDELFGGYAWFRQDRWVGPLAPLPGGLRQALGRLLRLPARHARLHHALAMAGLPAPARHAELIRLLGDAAAAALLSPDLREALARLPPSGPPALPERFPRWSRAAQHQYVEMTTRLPGLILPTLDRPSMARGVEARVPFLDLEVIALATAMPAAVKLRGRTEKHVLREALRGALPEEIRRRPKRGLIGPVHQWFREPLPPFAETLLSPAGLARTGYFDPAAVATALAEHRAGRAPRGVRLLAVLGVQLWDELFARGPGLPASPPA
jgi:asparagine synthase (glutamine-hydrolysing)